MVKKILHNILIFMATILTLVIVLLLLIHKGNFNALILSRGTQIANQQLEGKLSVEKLEGSLFSNFALKGILIKTQQDTLFYCEGIWIEYDPQKLLNKTIHLNHLHFENIYGKLYQNKDSLWNFEQLVQTDKKSNADTSKIASPWKLVLKDFQINSLLVNIEQAMKDSLLPSQIRANLQANGRYTPEHSHIQIDSLKMKSRNPNITMHKLTGRADYRLRDLSEFVF